MCCTKCELNHGKAGCSIKRPAFSLVEVIVVMAIIGTLTALLLPAIQAARESGRRAQCQNNLKNVSLALLSHHTAHEVFPSGGWGHHWVGMPGRGSGERQPGGWIYSILPFADEELLHDLGDGATGPTAHSLYSRRLATPIEILVCPTRRSSEPMLVSNRYPYVRSPKPFGNIDRVARSDYAINGGTSHVFSSPGPATLQEGDSRTYWRSRCTDFDGISHLRQGASLAVVADGASHTYLAGEKHVFSEQYFNGESIGDNESMYAGYCSDLHRVAGIIERMAAGMSPFVPPLRDDQRGGGDVVDFLRFGSAHASGFNMSYCDGSVRSISFEVDGEAHFRAANRRDRGAPLERLR